MGIVKIDLDSESAIDWFNLYKKITILSNKSESIFKNSDLNDYFIIIDY